MGDEMYVIANIDSKQEFNSKEARDIEYEYLKQFRIGVGDKILYSDDNCFIYSHEMRILSNGKGDNKIESIIGYYQKKYRKRSLLFDS
jgi:hypothetical protein